MKTVTVERAQLEQWIEALYPISHNSTDDPRGQADKAITAMKEALMLVSDVAQPEHSYLPDLTQLHIPEKQPISEDVIEWLVSLGWKPPSS